MKYSTLTRPPVFGLTKNLSLTGVTVNNMQIIVMNLFQYKISLIFVFVISGGNRSSCKIQVQCALIGARIVIGKFCCWLHGSIIDYLS